MKLKNDSNEMHPETAPTSMCSVLETSRKSLPELACPWSSGVRREISVAEAFTVPARTPRRRNSNDSDREEECHSAASSCPAACPAASESILKDAICWPPSAFGRGEA